METNIEFILDLDDLVGETIAHTSEDPFDQVIVMKTYKGKAIAIDCNSDGGDLIVIDNVHDLLYHSLISEKAADEELLRIKAENVLDSSKADLAQLDRLLRKYPNAPEILGLR